MEALRAPMPNFGEVYRTIIGNHFPVMTASQVAGFVEDGAKIEIEVTAMPADRSLELIEQQAENLP